MMTSVFSGEWEESDKWHKGDVAVRNFKGVSWNAGRPGFKPVCVSV